MSSEVPRIRFSGVGENISDAVDDAERKAYGFGWFGRVESAIYLGDGHMAPYRASVSVIKSTTVAWRAYYLLMLVAAGIVVYYLKWGILL